MKNLIILFLFFIAGLKLNAQVIHRSELEKFRWFTDNSNKSFYKSDTISLIQITDTFPESQELNRQYRELDYNKNNNLTTIEFKRKSNLEILDIDVESWTTFRRYGKWKWKFDFEKQLISFYFKGKVHSSFLVKERLTDSLINKYTDYNNKPIEKTYHLLTFTLIRVK